MPSLSQGTKKKRSKLVWKKSTTNKPLMDCEGIILSACEVNNCPKQAVSGLSHPGVCQISCDAVGKKDCSSWSYYENEKVRYT